MRRLGLHTSTAGGLHLALQRASALGCTTMQIFSHNPRGWAVKEISEEEGREFRRIRSELDISPVFIHASYLLNMASPEQELRAKSIKMLAAEMDRADAIGADYVVLHPGSAVGRTAEEARASAAEALREVSEMGPWHARLLLENTAAGIASGMKEIASLAEGLEGFIGGLCIDSCHAFQAGFELRSMKGIDAFARDIETHAGSGSVHLIHLNDSKAEFASGRDRHEHIGKGSIGTEGLGMFLNHPFFSSIPVILETPKDTDEDDKENLGVVRGLIV